MSGWFTNPGTVELHAGNTQHDRDPAARSFGSDALGTRPAGWWTRRPSTPRPRRRGERWKQNAWDMCLDMCVKSIKTKPIDGGINHTDVMKFRRNVPFAFSCRPISLTFILFGFVSVSFLFRLFLISLYFFFNSLPSSLLLLYHRIP